MAAEFDFMSLREMRRCLELAPWVSERARPVTGFVTAAQMAFAAVLLVAAAAKIARAAAFEEMLWRTLRPALVAPAVVAVPAVELGLALLLLVLTGPPLALAFAAVAILLLGFAAWMGSILRQGLRLRCSCFGRSSAEIGVRTILRNGLLAGLALASAYVARTEPTHLPPFDLAVGVTVTSVSASLFLLAILRELWNDLIKTLEDLERLRP